MPAKCWSTPGVADVYETVAVKSVADIGELVLSADEVRGDSGTAPQARLEAECAIELMPTTQPCS